MNTASPWYNQNMKRLIILLTLILLISGCSFAQSEEIHLNINGQAVNLEHPIIWADNGEFLVPMEAFFAALQIPIDELPSGQLAVFRDNIFVKFRPNFSLYEVNGREYRWRNIPAYRNEVLYVPIDMFIQYMDLDADFDKDSLTLNVRSTRALDFFHPESTATKQVPSLRTGLRYSVPNFWKRMDPGYGAQLQEHPLLFDLDRLRSEASELESAIQEFLIQPEQQLSGYQALPVRELSCPLFDAQIYPFIRQAPTPSSDSEKEASTHQIQFGFFEINDAFYVAKLQSSLADSSYLEQLLDDILMSIQSATLSIDALSEHYVEFRNYSRFNSFISSPIYSNIPVSGHLSFRGNIDPAIEYLDVIVSRGRRHFEYQIPVSYGTFSDSIPIPFGLGFHQVNILLPENVDTAEDFYFEEAPNTLIKFSVINRTLGEGLLVSSSKLVNTQHELVQQTIEAIPEDLTNYAKAKQAFAELEQFNPSSNQTLEQLLNDSTGSSKAVAALYTSYLRAMNIPTRLVKPPHSQEYYVEFFSNGKWVFTRPMNYVRVKDNIDVYFDVSRPIGMVLDILDY